MPGRMIASQRESAERATSEKMLYGKCGKQVPQKHQNIQFDMCFIGLLQLQYRMRSISPRKLYMLSTSVLPQNPSNKRRTMLWL